MTLGTTDHSTQRSSFGLLTPVVPVPSGFLFGVPLTTKEKVFPYQFWHTWKSTSIVCSSGGFL